MGELKTSAASGSPVCSRQPRATNANRWAEAQKEVSDETKEVSSQF